MGGHRKLLLNGSEKAGLIFGVIGGVIIITGVVIGEFSPELSPVSHGASRGSRDSSEERLCWNAAALCVSLDQNAGYKGHGSEAWRRSEKSRKFLWNASSVEALSPGHRDCSFPAP